MSTQNNKQEQKRFSTTAAGLFIRRAAGYGCLGLLALLLLSAAAEARVGGGQAFSGGGESFHVSGVGEHGGGEAGLVLFLIQLVVEYPAVGLPVVIVVLVAYYLNSRQDAAILARLGDPLGDDLPSSRPTGVKNLPPYQAFPRLRTFDPNFSEISFADFTYALYALAHEARGRGELAELAPYLSPGAAATFPAGPPQIQKVTGVIVGGATVLQVSDPDARPEVMVVVRFKANYTEIDPAGAQLSYYVEEDWTYVRRRDVLTPAPEKLTALHCPKCGGSLELKTDGSCAFCGVTIMDGNFNWYVTRVNPLERMAQGPLLTQTVQEVGTDARTVYQPDLVEARKKFLAANPDFQWDRTEARFRDIFTGLQGAWSSMKWNRARAYETDNVFQMHRYWIEAYRKQGLRNVLEQVRMETVTPVKYASDVFYDSITCRIFADMLDYTQDAQGKVITGSKTKRRRFSEYWTFIRGRGVPENKHTAEECPNCGAPLKVNMAGSCEFCGGKITSGQFDWVLSRIEQDETYSG